jgi:hypothetical protein
MVRKLYFILFSLSISLICYSQENDTTSSIDNLYYSDLSQLLHLRIYTLAKLNTIEIKYQEDKLRFEPNGVTSIGAGFNYKGIGLALGIGIPSTENSIRKYGKTNRLDIQAAIFSKRVAGDAYLQAYKGYYIANPGDFMEWNSEVYPQLPEMRTISLGVSVFYIFNNKRFSYKAGFVRTQIQEKSAGSFAGGLFFNYDDVSSKNGFFPDELPDSLGIDFDITAFRYIATGFNIGYVYTWVISKNFFLNISTIPGLGYKDTQLKTSSGESGYDREPHWQLLLRGAFGYEHKNIYAGVTASTLIRNIKYKDYDINLSTEKFRLYVGMRFNVGKR